MKIVHPLEVSKKIFAARVIPPPKPIDLMDIDRVRENSSLSPAERVYASLSFSEAMLLLSPERRLFFDCTHAGAGGGEDVPEKSKNDTPLTQALHNAYCTLHLFTACLSPNFSSLKGKLFASANNLLDLLSHVKRDPTLEAPALKAVRDLLQEFQLQDLGSNR